LFNDNLSHHRYYHSYLLVWYYILWEVNIMPKRRNALPDNVIFHKPSQSFLARKMFSGHRYSAYHKTSATAALRAVDAQIEEAKRKGRPHDVTIGDIGKEWLKTKQNLVASTVYNIESNYKKHIEPIQHTRLQLFEVQAWVDDVKTTVAPSTLKNIWAIMNQILCLARKKGLIQYSSEDVILPKVQKTKKSMQPESHMDKIMKAAKKTMYYDIILFSRHTGLRREDVIPLQWDDFDFKNNILHIRRFCVRGAKGKGWRIADEGKTRKSVRDIPVAPWVMDHVKKMRRKSDYVFTGTKGTYISPPALYEGWKLITERAGVPMKWHGLRHQFASELLNQGVSAETISFLLGHTTVQMTHTYSHIAFEYAQGIINGLQSGLSAKPEQPAEPETAYDFSI
jgi:integrase